jgi:hypothetical protein
MVEKSDRDRHLMNARNLNQVKNTKATNTFDDEVSEMAKPAG